MMRIHTFSGSHVAEHLNAVAALRMAMFREWPYLYAGAADYEARYLARYAESAGSVFVLAFDGDRVVGASTGQPLADENIAFRAPFQAAGIDAAGVFYFGESVLLHDYRGRGIGHRFFDERERHARLLGQFGTTAFCAVIRDADDPRRPAEYRGNEAFWGKRGYRPREDLTCTLDWPEIGGGEAEVAHRLRFWTRPLELA